MIRPSDIHSVTTFTRNAKKLIEQVKESRKPIVLTVNGEAEVVIHPAETYEELQDIHRAMVDASIARGLEDLNSGRVHSLEEAMLEVDEILGL